ncbi:hypothetical protein BDC45DRAFT_504517 [Circinella umbellata]|nr:hypothetical protein BDC45DRAFT_504517 [Circinella umbellata]
MGKLLSVATSSSLSARCAIRIIFKVVVLRMARSIKCWIPGLYQNTSFSMLSNVKSGYVEYKSQSSVSVIEVSFA